MKTEKLYRQIDVFDKKTEKLILEISIENFDLEKLKSAFKVPANDPLMYYQYEIDVITAKLFPEINFDFKHNSYIVSCFRGLTKDENEFFTINKFCRTEFRERVQILMKTNRKKFRNSLSHFEVLDFKLFENLNKSEKETIRKRAENAGINKVQIISESSNYDYKILNLEQYFNDILFSGYGNLSIFGDSEFVVYEGEGKNNRWISK
jgi:hypothetical protein